MEEIVKRFHTVAQEMEDATRAAGRPSGSVRLIAVSKTKPIEMIAALHRAGHRDFGENYVQELLAKAEQARSLGLDGIRWHFLGHLQTNKVKQLLPHVHLIHSVDSVKLLQEIEKRADRTIDALIEVKLDPEPTKAGVEPSGIDELLSASRGMKNVRLLGLMGIPDPNRAGGAAGAFQRLAQLAHDHSLTELSMGMTADYAEAIRAGSTCVRVGTAIFGSRS